MCDADADADADNNNNKQRWNKHITYMFDFI